MGTISDNLYLIKDINYNGNRCNKVDFDGTCVWVRAYTLTIPREYIGWGHQVTVTRLNKEGTLPVIGTIETLTGSSNGLIPETKLTVFYGDTIAVSVNNTNFSVSPSSQYITGDATVTFTSGGGGGGGSEYTVSFTFDNTPYTVTAGTTWGDWTESPYGTLYHHSTGMVAPVEAAASAGMFILHSNGKPVYWDEAITADDYYTGPPKD